MKSGSHLFYFFPLRLKRAQTTENQNKKNLFMCDCCVFVGFPFYTVGRFVNAPCLGANQLMGTCVLHGECKKAGGVATGSCNSVTRQATCCVCKKLKFNCSHVFG